MFIPVERIEKRMSEIRKTLELYEFMKNNGGYVSTNPAKETKPEIETLSVQEICSKYYFVTGGNLPGRFNVLSVFKSMLKNTFNEVCDLYLKSLHALLSSQSSDTFQVYKEENNISYLSLGEKCQFIMIPQETDINNFIESHKEIILEHTCNFYQFSVDKKEKVLQKFVSSSRKTEENVDKKKDSAKQQENRRKPMKKSNNSNSNGKIGSVRGERKQSEKPSSTLPKVVMIDKSKPMKNSSSNNSNSKGKTGSVLGKRKQSEKLPTSLPDVVMEPKKQRKSKNKANDAVLNSLITEDDVLIDGKLTTEDMDSTECELNDHYTDGGNHDPSFQQPEEPARSVTEIENCNPNPKFDQPGKPTDDGRRGEDDYHQMIYDEDDVSSSSSNDHPDPLKQLRKLFPMMIMMMIH